MGHVISYDSEIHACSPHRWMRSDPRARARFRKIKIADAPHVSQKPCSCTRHGMTEG